MKKIVDLDKFHKYCDECFSRLDTTDHYEQGERIGLIMALDWLNAQPEAEEEKRGKWIDLAEGDYKCSNCNEILTIGEDCHPIYDCGLYYCPYCGAKMDLE